MMVVPAAQRILALHDILLCDRDSAGPGLGGPTGQNLVGSCPGGLNGLTSPVSQMTVLLMCICVEATVRET